MTFPIKRIAIAVLVAVIVGLVLVALLGPILLSLHIPITSVLGHFCVDWGWVVGIIAGLWYFFSGSSILG